MSRFRIVLGLIAGGILVASSAAHSFLGWTQLRAALVRSQAPPDLVAGLAVGWHFAGVAMLTFGCIVIWLFTDALRSRPVSLLPAAIIAFVYVVFGIGALIVSAGNPFFFVFIVPGLMLFVASSWPATAPSLDGSADEV
jgi:hypothetical protein